MTKDLAHGTTVVFESGRIFLSYGGRMLSMNREEFNAFRMFCETGGRLSFGSMASMYDDGVVLNYGKSNQVLLTTREIRNLTTFVDKLDWPLEPSRREEVEPPRQDGLEVP